jgi:hypothetical protein
VIEVAFAANSSMSEVRLWHLSPARQTLVRMLQAVNFGELQSIQVRESDPVFDGATVVILDVKLDKEDGTRPELDLADFGLSAEVLRLMSRLDELKNGTIQRLEVRAGTPRRLVFETRYPSPRNEVG